MSAEHPGYAPTVEIVAWPQLRFPRREITGALAFLAYKARRPVRFSRFYDTPVYSSDMVNFAVCTAGVRPDTADINTVRLGGESLPLQSSQRLFEGTGLPGQRIEDEAGTALALVDHNNVVLLADITVTDNTTARRILSHVAERAAPLLDFDVEKKRQEQREEIAKAYDAFHNSALRALVSQKELDISRREQEANNLYSRLVNVERELPFEREELGVLKELVESVRPRIVEKQAEGILSLLASGEYETITPFVNGRLFARTSTIVIEHDGWLFNLGRYEITIDPRSEIIIRSCDGTDGDGYPHPHIDSNGSPCLGNIHGDVGRAFGRMHIYEGLTLLHSFLSTYNPEGPFANIGRFDPEYDDPDGERCDNCEDCRTPYCIMDCGHNEVWCCADCLEYRTGYCFRECPHNVPGFTFERPCDHCDDKQEEHCYLVCEYNDKWELENPCEDCRLSDCSECPYREKKEQLGVEQHATTQGN